MTTLNLTYAGRGQFTAATKLDMGLAAKWKKGERVRAKITRMRSHKQNNFFHAVVAEAFDNLRKPQSSQFLTPKHLKSYLLIMAGWCEEHRHHLKDLGPKSIERAVPLAAFFAAQLRKRVPFVMVTLDEDRNDIVIRFAKSWRFDGELKPEHAVEIVDASIVRICAEIIPGTKIDDLRRAALGRPSTDEEVWRE